MSAEKIIHFAVEAVQILLNPLHSQRQLPAIVFDELAEIRDIDGNVMHEAAAEVDILFVHKGEDLLGADIEFLADRIYGNLHGRTIKNKGGGWN